MALMMEAERTSEMLVNFHLTTRRYNPEDSHHLLILIQKVSGTNLSRDTDVFVISLSLSRRMPNALKYATKASSAVISISPQVIILLLSFDCE
jgi:hypothetical protein